MHAPNIAQLLEITEVSEWLDWMRRTLPPGGVELPNEETSVLFATNAVRFAERLRPLCPHFPDSLRSLLIESGILRQCWRRQLRLHEKRGMPPRRNLAHVEIGSFLDGVEMQDGALVEASDGFVYQLKFHDAAVPDRLATEAICLALARGMGLSVPEFVVVSTNRKMKAPSLGIRPGHLTKGSQAFGFLILSIVALNCATTVRHSPEGLDFAHCLMDADWSKFLSANELEFPPAPAIGVRSFAQLEPWVRRAEDADMNPLWELAFQLPPSWYGNDRIGITRVLDKLSLRIGRLRNLLRHLTEAGHFPNLKKEPQPERVDEKAVPRSWRLEERKARKAAHLKHIM